ncbi:helix-turn-helix domain-containing protein [Cellulosimicrobium cellulans]|uniref:winged helix-turn-helix transcriptional regulator n=1 Tax=Cellulosimicrobium cellulans TaxID=1710 RepID=UPI0029166C14|nr:helix-turn-helix domain-containing protein [Cellulosimicrobium cellulans]
MPALSAPPRGCRQDGPLRFGELRARLEGISPKVLTATLRRLEEHGPLTRTVFAEVPPRVEQHVGHAAP